ncbi:hypothetical protein ISU07_09585 [Nocardioides islandensis]|uniref:Uncharacterized protein n=1 Tax=Nocardioides islandensis TaxID=433663 RepID=A0A930VG83_9ACTN|nr:hypothetical protein [Nocardioides islandensis]MBF4763375.1 hypothetical protein [Nocardioides islandensis]
MSVADYFGFDDPESALMTEARAGWLRWCAENPDLAVVDDLTDLRAWTWCAEREAKGRVFGRLAEIAQTEDAARAALVWLLLPGAVNLADGLRDLTADIDGLVAGQLWIEVSRSHLHSPYGLAKAVLNSTRRAVLAELGVGSHGRQRDRAWSQAVLLDRFEEQAVQGESERVDPYDELVEVLDAALRDNAVGGIDVWLLHELAVAAHAADAPMRRGRCGLTSPALVDQIARRRPEAARTLRRWLGSAVDELAAYVDCWQDDARLKQWRADHPHRLPTERDLLETERVYDEFLTSRGQGPRWEPVGTDGVPLVLRASA